MSLTTPTYLKTGEEAGLQANPKANFQDQDHIMEPVDRVSLKPDAELGARLEATKANDDTPQVEPLWGRIALSPGARWMGIAGLGLAGLATLVAVTTYSPWSLLMTLGMFAAGFIALYAVLRGAFWPNASGRSDLPWADAFDALPEAIFITSRGGRLVFANQSYKDLLIGFGIKRELPLSRALARDRSLGPVLYRLEVSARRGNAVREGINLAAPSGVMHYCVIEAKPLKSPTRYIMWTISEQAQVLDDAASLTDAGKAITDDAPVGDALHAIHGLPLPAFWVDSQGAIKEVNVPARALLGLADDADLSTTNLQDLFEGVGALPPTSDLALGGTSLLAGQISLRLGTDDVTSVSLWRHAADDGTSTVFCLSSVQNDMGFQGQVAGALAEIMGKAPIAIAVVDKDGNLSSANQSFRSLAGRDNLDGANLDALIAAESRDVVRSLIDPDTSAIAGSHVPEIVFGEVSPGSDNRARTATAFMAPLDDQGSSIMLAIDITERKKLEMQFHQAQKMQTVGRLAGGIAHDFNNLLTAIIGFCDLLLVRHQVGDPSFADIDQIRQNASRAASLTGQLLAFSRRQNLVPKVLNLTDHLSEAAALLRRMLGEKVELEIIHGRDLARIKADESQITQVLTNLAVNAKDAMEDDGTVTITTRMVGPEEVETLGHSFMVPAEYVLIEVADTGSGIPDDVKEQIFEPFFTTKGLGSGTGLGLSTVYGIVKQTGGYIIVDSEVGKGTTFSVFLPAYDGDEVATSDVAREAEAADNDTTGQGVVLLVEDETSVRAFSSRALTMRGYTVLEAEDGEDALRVIEEYEGEIDLVVSDVVMPGLDGPGMVERLRVDMPDLKVVFMSGYAEDSFRKQLEDAGGEVHFLPKPFSLPQLAGMVKKVIGDDANVG